MSGSLLVYTPTTVDDVFDPEVLAETVQGVFAQKDAFADGFLVRTGALSVSGTFPGKGAEVIGTKVKVPYFGTIGEFVPNPDGSAVGVSVLKQTHEESTVSRDSLAFSVSRWASSQGMDRDPYEEAAEQIRTAASRAIGKRCLDAAIAAGALVRTYYSSSSPKTLDWDKIVDAKFAWLDEQEDIVGMLIQSPTKSDLLKLRDSLGRPLLVQSMREGEVDTFCGIPMMTTDRIPFTGSLMGSVTSAGTSPPVVTLSGTPTGPWSLKIKITLAGNRGTATFQFSTDGGQNWSDDIVTGASIDLIDTAADSIVGNNGKSGVTAAFATGSAYSTDNVYTATANLKCRTILLKRRSLAFWYNQAALGMDTDKNILNDSRLAAMHLYGVAHRYRRVAGGTKPGVVVVDHNASGFTG